MRKNRLGRISLLAFKLAVVVILGWILVRMIDWPEFWRSLRRTSPWAFALAVFLNLVSAVVMSWRWHLLIKGAGLALSFRVATAYTFLGMFFNQILPGSISGDAARVVLLGGRHTSWRKSAGIVLWDRVLGLVALIFITLILLPVFSRELAAASPAVIDRRMVALTWLVLAAAFAAFLCLQSGWLLAKAERLAVSAGKRLRGEPGAAAVTGLFGGLRLFLTDRRLMTGVFFISLVVRVLWLLGAGILADSMGLSIPWLYLFLAISLVELVRMVPISIQGLGVRELAFVFFLAPWSVDATRATLLSMLFFTALTVAGLLAGLIYLLRRYWGGQIDAR